MHAIITRFSSSSSSTSYLYLCFFRLFSFPFSFPCWFYCRLNVFSFIFNLYLCLPTLFFSLSLPPCLWFDSIIIILYVQCILVFMSCYPIYVHICWSLLSSLLLSFDSLRFPSLCMSTHSSTRSLVEQLCEWLWVVIGSDIDVKWLIWVRNWSSISMNLGSDCWRCCWRVCKCMYVCMSVRHWHYY